MVQSSAFLSGVTIRYVCTIGNVCDLVSNLINLSLGELILAVGKFNVSLGNFCTEQENKCLNMPLVHVG